MRVSWVGDVLGLRGGILRRGPRVPQAYSLTCVHIYSYHQRNGFACILLEDVFQLG